MTPMWKKKASPAMISAVRSAANSQILNQAATARIVTKTSAMASVNAQ
jgi:hypothetical protein